MKPEASSIVSFLIELKLLVLHSLSKHGQAFVESKDFNPITRRLNITKDLACAFAKLQQFCMLHSAGKS